MPISSCVTTKNVQAKAAKPALYFSHIATNANTDAAQHITSNLKTPRDKETGHLRKQPSRLVATNHNIKNVDWLQSLNEDITWIKGDPIQKISQQLNQNRQAGKATSELHIVAHGNNGEVKLGNTFLTKQYLKKSSQLLQEWKLEAIYLWSCEAGLNAELTTTLEECTGADIYSSKAQINREQPNISSRKEKIASIEALIGQRELQHWNSNLTYVDGLQVELFGGINFDGLIQRQQEETINLDDTYITNAGGDGETWSMRAYGEIQAWTTGLNRWRTLSDDRIRIWINDELAVNNATDHSATWDTVSASDLVSGEWYSIKIEFAENTEVSQLRFRTWNDFNQLVPKEQLRFNTKAPIFQSATTSNDGTKVVLTYDEALSFEEASDWVGGTSSTIAATTDFTVTIDGTTANAVTAVAVSGATVELTLTNTVTNNETVTVSYTDPNLGSSLGNNDVNAIQGIQGNDAASITNKSVTNNSNVDGTPPLITGPSGAEGDATSTKSIAENTTAVSQLTANETVTWSLNGGADADKFQIDANGNLSFLAAPDFENPNDIGDTANNNTYVVNVRATDTSANNADQTLTITVTDVDENGVTIVQTGTTDGSGNLRTTEAGGSSTFTVVLDAQPTAAVTVSLTGNDTTEGSLSGTTLSETNTLTFTAANWNKPQTVTVTGVNDSILDGHITTTLTATTNSAGGYSGESTTTTVKNIDNDTNGDPDQTNNSQIEKINTPKDLDKSFDLVQTSEVTAISGQTDEGSSQFITTLSMDTLINYYEYQPKTLFADYNSLLGESGGGGQILKPLSDGGISQERGVKIIANSFCSAVDDSIIQHEASVNDAFFVVLTSAPTRSVMVSLKVPDSLQGMLSNNELHFTTKSWNIPQKVTFTAESLGASSKDARFQLIAIARKEGGYTGTEQDSVIFNNSEKPIKQTSTGSNRTENRFEEDPINLDVERNTVHEELSPMFTILRIISFPAVAFISFALKSIEKHQSKNTYSDQSRNQTCSHEAPDVIAIEPITINNFNQNLSQSAFHLTENNHYSLNESSMLLPQVSQLADLCL